MLAQAAKDAVFLSAHHVHLNQARFVRHDLTIMTRPRKVFHDHVMKKTTSV